MNRGEGSVDRRRGGCIGEQGQLPGVEQKER